MYIYIVYIYIYICVCMCLCMYIYTYIYTHIYICYRITIVVLLTCELYKFVFSYLKSSSLCLAINVRNIDDSELWSARACFRVIHKKDTAVKTKFEISVKTRRKDSRREFVKCLSTTLFIVVPTTQKLLNELDSSRFPL